MRDAYVVAAVRTPVGKAPRGALRHVRPDDMLAHVLKAAISRCPGLDRADIADVIVGCAMPEAEQGMNVARVGLLLAGFPDTVPGFTVNRFCASSLQAVALAADRIRLGEADIVMAGGTESMSMIPMGGNRPSFSPAVFESENVAIAFGMGITAERVAAQWKVSRQEQDAYAAESHRRAVRAIDAEEFGNEIAPFTVQEHEPDLGSRKIVCRASVLTGDEGPRRDTSREALGRLKPAFAIGGSVTAGNSSQMSDGAAAIVLVSEDALKRLGLAPLGRFVSYAVAGVAPDVMGIGPVSAVPRALELAALRLDQIDRIELNEAFAAQTIAVMRELRLDPVRVNPSGGAIALGHPLGATGAIRVATLLHGMRRERQKYGMVTMCVGTGMGAAGLFEAL